MRLNRDERGFSLTEIAVASLIFLFIAIAAFSVFNQSNKLYKSGDAQAEMAQRTRLAFAVMLDELRLAGFDFNRDGDENEYADHPDEQIEYAAAHAITFRGNLDHDDGVTGREAPLEIDQADPGWGTLCCPIVTTGNDEIVTYALRSDDASRNVHDIIVEVDTSAPRDAGWDGAGLIVGEESVTIENVDLDGGDPPYTLMRFVIDDAGAVSESPIATNIRALSFTYEGADGNDYYCLSYEADGTCVGGNQVPFDELLGDNDINTADGRGRSGREAIRTLRVELVGMSEKDELGWADANDSLMPGRRKLSLTATVVPQNLGLKGRPDIDDREAEAPTNVTLCPGQCNTIRVEWDESDRATGYIVKLFANGALTPFFSGATPGISVPNSSPARVYAYFQRTDAPQIVSGAVMFARVASRVSGDRTSEDSLPSAAATITDLVRVEEPKNPDASGYDPAAIGWPDVVTNAIPPVTLAGLAHRAQENSIVVAWDPPIWALQVTDSSDPLNTAVTRSGSGTYAPLDCDKEAVNVADGVTPSPSDYRTRARDIFGANRYLIFRSTNPRFVPTNADFVAATQGDVDILEGRVAYVDRSIHAFQNGVFNSTTNALQNCTTYYYRVRAVDDCWDGTDPAGSSEHVSPFSPRLNPSPSADNSDDVTSLTADDVSLAIPGYAIPKAVPKAPTHLRFTRHDRDMTDGDAQDAVIGFNATKMDGTTTGAGTWSDPFMPAWEDVTIGEYRVFSGPNANFTLEDCKSLSSGVVQEAVLSVNDLKAGRIAYDDENGNGTVQPFEDEVKVPTPWPTGVLPRTGLRIDLGSGANVRYYKVVALQCVNENTVPDPLDHEAFDWGELSEARKFPCDFGGGPYSQVTVDAASFPSSVTCNTVNELDTVASVSARLIIKDRATGDRNITPEPGPAPTALGAGEFRKIFDAGEIASLTDNFGGGSYFISCEMTDANGCIGQSDAQDQVLTTPSCCLSTASPVALRLTTQRIKNTITEACGIQYLRIYKITLSIDNANGGGGERFQAVQWNGSPIWTGNSSNPVISRTSNPLTLASAQSGELTMDFQRSAVGDNVTIRYDYKIGGVAGFCTFTGRIN